MVEVEGGKNGEFALGQVVKGFIKRAKFSKGLLTSERDKMCMRKSLFCSLAKSFPHCLLFIC